MGSRCCERCGSRGSPLSNGGANPRTDCLREDSRGDSRLRSREAKGNLQYSLPTLTFLVVG
eukprot:scaffold9977_cov35-Tisochrysis_lutea.AAC.1